MKHPKNKINFKWFVLVVFVITVIFSSPTAKAEINDSTSASNQQLIVLLKQLIVLLTQQVEELQKQLIVQQQAVESLKISTTQATSSIQQISNKLEIISVNITLGRDSVKIEWQTTQPAESKVFIYKNNLSSKVFGSDQFSTIHSVNIMDLGSDTNTNYLYDITALNEAGFSKKSGSFSALPHFVAEIFSDKDTVINDGVDYATVTIKTKLSNGQILSYKEVKINNRVYISDYGGTIVYRTQPTKIVDCCGGGSASIAITADGKSYTKSIGIINVQPKGSCGSGGSLMYACP